MNKQSRYEYYKESGVEWIGEVPKHWAMTKLKNLFGLQGGHAFPEKLQGREMGEIPFLKVSDINVNGYNLISSSSNYVDRQDINEYGWKLIKRRSLLMAKIGEALRKNHRKINAVKCIIDNNMMALVPNNNIRIDFAYYLFILIDMDWFVNPGTVPSVDNTKLKNTYTVQPSIYEQLAIANFLDHKTSEIDALIADKEKLIELLKEQRQAIITEAVTKGLNPDMKMKDSGVEWIGDVPEHWEVKRLKYLAKMINEKARVVDLEKPYIGLENIKSKVGKLQFDTTIDEEQVIEGDSLHFKPADVLFGKLRPYLAKCFLADFHGRCSSELLILRSKGMLPRYLFYFMLSDIFIQVVNSSTYGAKMPRASWSFIRDLEITLPPVNEIQDIVNYLDINTSKIDLLVMDIKAETTKLKEYRQSLIYEAVTGKIDVRDWADKPFERSDAVANA